jgi:uncharacterized lipoprotein YbaY
MKISFPIIFRSACALSLALIAAGCAARPETGPVVSLPVTKSGPVASARAFESQDSVYVAGTVNRPFGHHLPHSAHVDVELLDASGRVIASRQDAIRAVHPRHENRRGGQYSFAIGFPKGETGGAQTIRVSYHAHSHS